MNSAQDMRRHLKPDQLLVSEIFGPTIQGEGPSSGRPAMFLRLGDCNLTCDWCDTRYTWDNASFDMHSELAPMGISDIASKLQAPNIPLIVITGGEPLLQKQALGQLLNTIQGSENRIEIETNGTLNPAMLADRVNKIVVSPKLSNSLVTPRLRGNVKMLKRYADLRNVEFKFVVGDVRDLCEIEKIADALSLSPDRVWIMPEATNTEALIRGLNQLTKAVTERGWSLSGRLQVLIWGNDRGH